MAKPGSCGEDMTVFEILSRCGRILLGDEEMEILYAWNGSLTFSAFQHAGHGRFYQIDAWTVEEAPRSLDVAMDKCRARLSDALADEGVNEVHDARVIKRKAAP